jgi:hypothetical protein
MPSHSCTRPSFGRVRMIELLPTGEKPRQAAITHSDFGNLGFISMVLPFSVRPAIDHMVFPRDEQCRAGLGLFTMRCSGVACWSKVTIHLFLAGPVGNESVLTPDGAPGADRPSGNGA